MADMVKYPNDWTVEEEMKFKPWYQAYLGAQGLPGGFDFRDKLFRSREAFRAKKSPFANSFMSPDNPSRMQGSYDRMTGRIALQKDMEKWRQNVMKNQFQQMMSTERV